MNEHITWTAAGENPAASRAGAVGDLTLFRVTVAGAHPEGVWKLTTTLPVRPGLERFESAEAAQFYAEVVLGAFLSRLGAAFATEVAA